MNNNNDETKKSNQNIKNDLISRDLTELLKPLLAFVILALLFGYAGYTYSIDNNLDIRHGIVFGSLFPLGIALIKVLDFDNIFTYIIYTIAYICIVDYIPTFVGIIILFIIVAIFILSFVYIEKKDRTEEISSIKYNESKITHPVAKGLTKNVIKNYISEIEDNYEDKIEKDMFDDEEELEYECERCFKKITFEEYDLNDCMCEDCYQDVHTDEHGNFHDDKYFDV